MASLLAKVSFGCGLIISSQLILNIFVLFLNIPALATIAANLLILTFLSIPLSIILGIIDIIVSFVYKEKISKFSVIGIILGVIAIILLIIAFNLFVGIAVMQPVA